MKKLNKLQNFVYMAGAVLLLLGAAVYFTRWAGAFYLYTVGACCFAAMQFLAGYEGRNWVVRRLRRQQILGALFLLVTAVAMSMNTFHYGFAQRNEWMLTLCLGCVFEMYTAFRIPAELEKENR